MNYAIFYVAEVPMPYDVLEKQIKSLPPSYYNELVDYLEFFVSKAKKNAPLTEEESLKKNEGCRCINSLGVFKE